MNDIAKQQTKTWQQHGGELIACVNDYDVIACETCGFVHAVPLPDRQQARTLYQKEYYGDIKPDYIARHEQDAQWWSMVNSERLQRLESLCGATKDVLDIGCGPGFFLAEAVRRGWTARGVEPSVQAAEYASRQGINVYHGEFDDEFVAQGETFNAVYLSEVLEHVGDPAGILRNVKKVLQPDGALCVVVPNDFNAIQRAAVASLNLPEWWIIPPHHINYFDFNSLCTLLERSGFTVVHQEATFPIDLFLLMGDNYVGDDIKGRQCHEKRKQMELHLHKQGLSGLKRKLYQAFAELNIGREIVVYCKVKQ